MERYGFSGASFSRGARELVTMRAASCQAPNLNVGRQKPCPKGTQEKL